MQGKALLKSCARFRIIPSVQCDKPQVVECCSHARLVAEGAVQGKALLKECARLPRSFPGLLVTVPDC